MENITRTVYGAYLQTCTLLGLPFSVKLNSTLNEKFNIQSGVYPNISSEIPKTQYWVIGNGGHRMTSGADGIAKPEPIQHRTTDAALFNHLPFVLREPSLDLDNVARAQYALRRTETHNGVQYIAYYGRRIPLDGVIPDMEYNAVVDGTTTVTPFNPDSSNLNPTPPELSSDGVNLVTGDYTTATALVNLLLSKADVAELLNVAKIIYGDDSYAIISEIGLVSGVDRTVSSPATGNTTINFNEVIAAQIVSHVATFYPLKFSNNGVELILDVGATEPLFSLT